MALASLGRLLVLLVFVLVATYGVEGLPFRMKKVEDAASKALTDISTYRIRLSDDVELNVAFSRDVNATDQQVLLLHGWPEGWYSWIDVFPYLSANFSLIAPDLKGFNLSDTPVDPAELYNVSILVKEIVSLIRLTGQPVTIIGHDIGGLLAWVVAAQYPELVQGLVIINAPHPDVFVDLLHNDQQQQNASDYIFTLKSSNAVQILTNDNFSWLFQFLAGSWLTPAKKQVFSTAWSIPNEVDASLNFFRTNFFGSDSFDNISTNFPANLQIKVNTLVIWGTEDNKFVASKNIQGLYKYVPQLTVVTFPSGHWPQHENAYFVAEQITAFIFNNTNVTRIRRKFEHF